MTPALKHWARIVLALSVLAHLAQAARRGPLDRELPPGWRLEEAHKPSEPAAKPWMEVLDEDARIFLFHNFLTPEECDHIISLAEPQMARSGVVADGEGNSAISDVRTSSGTFLERGQDVIVADIERRIARWTLIPANHGEGLQVLRYEKNQKYEGHLDWFWDKHSTENGGNRYATVLTYLSDVEEGGETTFPNIPAPGGENPGFSECARYHLAAKPRKGDAVLFHSMKLTGEVEPRSLHAACPVIKGVKWSMPRWLHVGPYATGNERPVPVTQHIQKVAGPYGCSDKDASCAEWAASGECENNPKFMIGTRLQPGTCIQACNRCEMLAGGTEGVHQRAKVAA